MARHVVRTKNPHLSSMAALVLLQRRYRKAELQGWLNFRKELLREAQERDGRLICHYCGRDDLVEDIPNDSLVAPKNLATIDHVVPISKGGGRYDKGNCEIACYPCNQRKGDELI